jgi:uncharacterized protein (DUF1778 family)
MGAAKEGERIQVPLEAAESRLFGRGAATLHISVSAFVVRSSINEAVSVLAERSLIELDAISTTAFTEALEQPASVNQRLAASLRGSRKFGWLD